jgi:arginine/lysine/ornithine decarboxylase
MGAMLHVQGQFIDIERLRDMLAVIQSSSPSFPIMASLDIARAMIEEEGPALFEPGLRQAESFRQEMKRRNGRLVAAAGENQHGQSAEAKADGYGLLWMDEVRIDPLRVIMRDQWGVVSGYELLRMLERHGCWAEMADEHRVLLLFGPFVSENDTKRLLDACEAMEQELVTQHKDNDREGMIEASTYRLAGSRDVDEDQWISLPVAFSTKRMTQDTVTTVPLMSAVGYVSAETIIPYPPGIPLVYAGERLQEGVLTRIAKLIDMGAKCQGAADPTLKIIRVIQQ